MSETYQEKLLSALLELDKEGNGASTYSKKFAENEYERIFYEGQAAAFAEAAMIVDKWMGGVRDKERQELMKTIKERIKQRYDLSEGHEREYLSKGARLRA